MKHNASLQFQDFLDDLGDVLGGQSVVVQKGLGGSGPGHFGNCNLSHHNVALFCDGREDGLSQTALGIVILNSHHAAAACPGVLDDSFPVQGLDGEGIQDSHADALGGEVGGSAQSFGQGDASTDYQDLVVVALLHNMSFANLQQRQQSSSIYTQHLI